MSDPPSHEQKKTLEIRQTWFLGVMAAAVILMFAFVILPYVDPPAQVSGHQATEFDLELINGGKPGDRVRLSDLKGHIVVLDFWASWCAPCREQAVSLAEVARAVGDEVYVLGIATSDIKQEAVKYVSEHKPPYPNAFDDLGIGNEAYQVKNLPTLVVIDKAGQIKAFESRVLTKDEILRLIKSAGG